MENKRTGDGILTWDTASCGLEFPVSFHSYNSHLICISIDSIYEYNCIRAVSP